VVLVTTDRLTRRRVVAGATGLLAALAGCSSENPNDGGGGDDGEGGGGDGGDGGEEDVASPSPSPTPSGTPTATTPYPELAQQTATVAGSVLWHATEYESVVTRLRVLANRVVGVANELREARSVTQNDLTRLEDATTATAEFVRQNVQPYYPVENAVTNGDNTYVQQVKLAAERGDSGGLRQALGRVRTYYGNYARSTFLETQYPNDVIHERLYDRMTRDDATNVLFGLFHPGSGYVGVTHRDATEALDTDGVPQFTHEWDSGHVTAAHVHPHDEDLHDLRDHGDEPTDRRVYAYDRANGVVDILRDDSPDEQRMDSYVVARSDVFAPVRDASHDDEFYVEVGYTNAEFATTLPVHVQVFPSARDAERTVEGLLAADVFQQGTDRIVENRDEAREWRRVFYTRGEATLYAYMLVVGEVVLAVAPAETEWGSRVDWPGPLADCWLGDQTPLDT
jgi:hypothetical protein